MNSTQPRRVIGQVPAASHQITRPAYALFPDKRRPPGVTTAGAWAARLCPFSTLGRRRVHLLSVFRAKVTATGTAPRYRSEKGQAAGVTTLAPSPAPGAGSSTPQVLAAERLKRRLLLGAAGLGPRAPGPEGAARRRVERRRQFPRIGIDVRRRCTDGFRHRDGPDAGRPCTGGPPGSRCRRQCRSRPPCPGT